MERSNCTLSLLALPKNFTFSLCVPLSVTRPPHNLWWCSFFFLRPPSPSTTSDGSLDIFSFSNLQRGLRSVRFEDSRWKGRVIRANVMALPSFPPPPIQRTRVHSPAVRRGVRAARHGGTPTVVKIHRFHFRRGDEKNFHRIDCCAACPGNDTEHLTVELETESRTFDDVFHSSITFPRPRGRIFLFNI